MQEFNLKVNDRIEVIKDKKTFKTLIIDIQDDFLKINLPVIDGEYLMIQTNEIIEMNSYLDENRCYKFSSKVISRGKEGNIIYYKISNPFNLEKIQRRNFFRVSFLDTIEYKIITNIKEDEYDSESYRDGIMVDLSGGGLKLKVKENIKKDDLLLVKLNIRTFEIELKGKIVRVENTPDKEKLCGLKFLDITPSETDIIIQELFSIARKQRAKS